MGNDAVRALAVTAGCELRRCAVCAGPRLNEVDGFAVLPRVTSDVRPWPAGGRLAWCRTCGAVQKPDTAAWQAEVAAIYQAYAIYHQAGGAEQAVFDPAAAAPRCRSARLVEGLAATAALPVEGRVLDVGCGNGAFLAAFAAERPGWQLWGQDLGDRHRSTLERLPGFRKLHTGSLATIRERFDLVAQIHSLEHFSDPRTALADAAALRTGTGALLVQVPDVGCNPFDLIIADHRTHFTAVTLRRLAHEAGVAVTELAEHWVTKELSLVAAVEERTEPVLTLNDHVAGPRTQDQLAWLARVVREACALTRDGAPFGIFGTSIAGVWLHGALDARTAFFVDEDPRRIGRACCGLPIVAAAAVPAGSRVLVPLVPPVAEAVIARLGTEDWVIPGRVAEPS